MSPSFWGYLTGGTAGAYRQDNIDALDDARVKNNLEKSKAMLDFASQVGNQSPQEYLKKLGEQGGHVFNGVPLPKQDFEQVTAPFVQKALEIHNKRMESYPTKDDCGFPTTPPPFQGW